jgi:signal transduction histidine kinase/predicted hydrocarbon binding protein
LRVDSADPSPELPETVDAEPGLSQLFREAEKRLEWTFGQTEQSPGLARITIGDERYILVRAASVSLRFYELFREVLGSLLDPQATQHAAREVLYDLAHAIGRADARAILVGVEERERRLSFGPVHFAYTGWARVRLHPESDPTGDSPWLHYDHLHSFEADSFLGAEHQTDSPACVMNAGYSAGWVTESFGIRLEAAEVSCRARGDATCSFVMAAPEELEARIAQVSSHYQRLAPPPPYLLGERLLDKLAATERERDRSQAHLREQQATLAAFFAQAPIGAFFTTSEGGRCCVSVANPAAQILLGRRDVVGLPLEEALGLKEPEAVIEAYTGALAGSAGAYHHSELAYVGREEGVLDLHLFPIGDGQLAVLFRDRTAALRVQAAQREAERLEATATLAGGIAHDFNNLMTGILSHLTVLRRSQPSWEETDLILGEVDKAAQLASSLALQLVSFARGGKYESRRLRLGELVADGLTDLEIPEEIELEYHSRTMRDEVVGDQRQLARLLHELVNNAAEASGLTDSARIVVTVGRTKVESGEAQRVPPGSYVTLEVCDQGTGIPPAVQERMFEPYFSTRARGRGLGLAAAYGIVKNHGGAFVIESQPGFSTAVRVLLPAAGTRAHPVPHSLSESPFVGQRIFSPRMTPPLPSASASLTAELGDALAAARAAQEALAQQLPPELAEQASALESALAACDDLAGRLREQQTENQQQLLGTISDPGDLVRSVAERVTSGFPSEIELAVEVAPDLPALQGARRALENALVNLAWNSRDALAGGPGRVTLRARQSESEVFLEVEDSGPGITPEVLSRAREPFFTTKPEGGTGLGLSLVERVAQAHRGRLDLETSPGQGTRAALALPFETAAEAADASPRARTRRVLIVDDNAHVGRSTARLLEFEGYETLLAETGGAALDLFDESIDVVLLDLILPDRSGHDVFSALRNQRADLPVVLFSGYGEQADVSKLLSAGAHFIPKPFEVDELLEALERALARR